MKEYRHGCAGEVHWWDITCPYCHQSRMNWKHFVSITAVAVMTIYYLLKVF